MAYVEAVNTVTVGSIIKQRDEYYKRWIKEMQVAECLRAKNWRLWVRFHDRTGLRDEILKEAERLDMLLSGSLRCDNFGLWTFTTGEGVMFAGKKTHREALDAAIAWSKWEA